MACRALQEKSFYKTASLIAASCRSAAVFSGADEALKQARAPPLSSRPQKDPSLGRAVSNHFARVHFRAAHEVCCQRENAL